MEHFESVPTSGHVYLVEGVEAAVIKVTETKVTTRTTIQKIAVTVGSNYDWFVRQISEGKIKYLRKG